MIQLPVEPFQLEEEQYLLIEDWVKTNPNLLAGFTTRRGGVSKEPYTSLNVGFHVEDEAKDVAQNREIVAKKLQFPLNRWVVGEQVHGAKIKKISSKHKGFGAFQQGDAIQGVDGLYTREEDILLVSLYADCTPLYFRARNEKIVGLAHAGWRGTVQCIGANMINIWQEKEQIKLDDIEVVIGPSISSSKYEVDDFVIERVNLLLNDDDSLPYKKIGNNQYLLDLKFLNYLILLKAGLKREQIRISNYCTATNKELFYSHRYENGKTGRMMSFIGYRKD